MTKHTIQTPGSRCFKWLELSDDTLTLAFRDGTFRSYAGGKRLYPEVKAILDDGGSAGRWYNLRLRGTVAV